MSRPVALLLVFAALCTAWARDPTHPTGVTARVSFSGVVRIPAGEFVMGSDALGLARARARCTRVDSPSLRACLRGIDPADDPCDGALLDAERGDHLVWLSDYGIDRTEVTVGAYARCVSSGVCAEAMVRPGMPLYGGADHPVVGVSWDDARAYCHWVGGRLPTEAEWERTARGADARTWPWGWQWDPRRANHGGSGRTCRDADDGWAVTSPVGAYPDGASPEGVLDLAGNVMEWVWDGWVPEAPVYATDRAVDPQGPEHGADHVVRGGAWDTPDFTLRTTFRAHLPTGARTLDVGFRCAWDSG